MELPSLLQVAITAFEAGDILSLTIALAVIGFIIYGICGMLRRAATVMHEVIGTPERMRAAELREEAIAPCFKTHYDQYIRPLIEEFAVRRAATLRTLRLRGLVLLAAILILSLWVAVRPDALRPYNRTTTYSTGTVSVQGGVHPYTIWGSLSILALGIWTAWPIRRYKNNIRKQIFPEVFRYYGPQWKYYGSTELRPDLLSTPELRAQLDPELAAKIAEGEKQGLRPYWIKLLARMSDTVKMQRLKPYGILPTLENAITTDQLTGNYKSLSIDLKQTSLYGGNNNNVFNGLVILLQVAKPFSGHTTITADKGKAGNWIRKQFAASQLVRLEDPRFEERYEAYSTDQVEARYLLTTAFMERLMKLDDLFIMNGANPLRCAFKDGHMLLAIPMRREWFKPCSILKPVTFTADINLILEQMDVVFSIIDILKLDDRSGL